MRRRIRNSVGSLLDSDEDSDQYSSEEEMPMMRKKCENKYDNELLENIPGKLL